MQDEAQSSFDDMPIDESSLLRHRNSSSAAAWKPTMTDSSTSTDHTLLESVSLVQMLARSSSDSCPTPVDVAECEFNPRLSQVSMDFNNQALEANNSMNKNYRVPPDIPKPPIAIGAPQLVRHRAECRMALRPDHHKYVRLNFRVMRRHAEEQVGEIVYLNGVRRADLYTAAVLDRWTLRLQVKIKATVKVSSVFKSISARLGLQSTIGIKYCLDGFYGIETFGDVFGNCGIGICPWMEVNGDATPLSLKLEDADNIYISVVTEKMIEAVQRRVDQISDQLMKRARQRVKSVRLSQARQSALAIRDSQVRAAVRESRALGGSGKLPLAALKRVSTSMMAPTAEF